ncbi:hypothetical protein IC797_15005 [Acinetobacter seifertii]|uniref:hypothetical protein n=1 Tax=Acinetobacter seifertii TaxID=1530123 RepID=UPI00168D21E9|nr:hypothetical protein [Acinetobacter seifertii]QNW97586.1 hypothetical protein IC797_15005 [Acinetobacter seifertii]
MTLYDEVLLKLDYLFNEIETRESVAKWAFSMLNDNDLVIDQVVWNTLVRMGAVDIIDVNSKDGYLYTKEDFKEWIKILK